jgi:hypothetical protein
VFLGLALRCCHDSDLHRKTSMRNFVPDRNMRRSCSDRADTDLTRLDMGCRYLGVERIGVVRTLIEPPLESQASFRPVLNGVDDIVSIAAYPAHQQAGTES